MAMSLRSRIVLISSLAVTGALALSGVVIYIIVLNSTLNANDANLSAIAASNSMTITQWVNSNGRKKEPPRATEITERNSRSGLGVLGVLGG